MKRPTPKPLLIKLCLLLTMVLGAVGFTTPAAADIFMYKDKQGGVHFSNTPVDKRYELYEKESGVPGEGIRVQGPAEKRYDEEILRHSSDYSVDPAFIKAVMKTESDFNPTATSIDGAIGLMQLMPETAEKLGVQNPYDIKDNIWGGVKYLSRLLKQFGSFELAAAAYNSGENAVKKYNGIPPYNETKRYVKKVMSHYRTYKGESGSVSEFTGSIKEAIYMVKRPDGVTIYTNMPWVYQEPKRY